MAGLTTTELAAQLELSKGRISQLVSSGKLDGCFQGSGRARRFDLSACAEALGRRLDPGQMMGNGAGTRKRLRDLADDQPATLPSSEATPDRESRPLDGRDPDRYEMARTQKAEEEARKLRRQNAEAEGQYVLASSARQEAARMMALEIAQIETMLREAARAIADQFGVDYLEVRAKLMDQWRGHRGTRSEALTEAAQAAPMSEKETETDF